MAEVAAFLFGLFKALAAVKSIAEHARWFATQIIIWYIESEQNETLKQIADAAAYSARAKSQEERHAALDRWRSALSRPRIVS